MIMGETQDTGVLVAKNGVHIDPVTRRFVKGGKPSTAIADSSQGRELANKRYERKRDIIAAAAAAAVERDDYRAAYGDDAWIAAVAEAQYIKATTPDDPKSTDAARFLLSETGLAEPKQPQTAPIQAQNVYIVQVEEYVARLLTGEREPLDIINVIPDDETPTDAAQGTG